MKVYMPGRIVDGHVGGNTVYSRHIRDGLLAQGHQVESIKPASRPQLTMVKETLFGLKKPASSQELIHYVADTGPLLKPRYPSVVTVHGVASRWIDVARSKSADWVWRTRVQKAIDLTDRVITVSHSSADDVAEVFGIDQKSITVIPHGIDADFFATPTQISPENQAKITGPYVLYLGNIEPRKNLVPLLKAFQTPEVQALGLQLVIAGKPAWDFAETMAELERTPNTVHLGFVSDDDRRALMQAAELFVFPSLYEGFGFPVLEALAAGTVVLASRRGSLAEVAGPAIALEDLSVEGIAAGLVEAASSQQLRQTCLEQGRQWASAFSWEASVQAHLDVYKEVLR
ncbi:MAG: glycosyltransferase family 1 protein [Rothia sp. (in: high G+C Gram-positive bacteria)]|nr:glycosyltransferase family 1 protein [Rothia sp. (in: high G+C Gram-positive bacteria)]